MADMVALGAGIYLGTDNPWAIKEAFEWAKKDARVVYIVLLDDEQSELAAYNPGSLVINPGQITAAYATSEIGDNLFVAAPVDYQDRHFGQVILGYSLVRVNETIRNNRRTTVYICAAIMAIGIAVSFGLSELITRPILELTQATSALAYGRKNVTLDVRTSDELGQLEHEFNRMVHNITSSIGKQIGAITRSAKTLSSASGEISSSIERQAGIAGEQSHAISNITGTLAELAVSSAQIAQNSQSVADIAGKALEQSKRGLDAIETLTGKMEEIIADSKASTNEIVALGTKSKEIGRIMEMINNIADRTRLIAFNASIEAVGAGAAGKRFEVVAVEIRQLAENVTASTGDIETIVEEIQEAINHLVIASERGSFRIKEGADLAGQTLSELNNLVAGSLSTNDAARQISLSTRNQQSATTGVLDTLKDIEKAIQKCVDSINQTRGVVGNLTAMADELNELLQRVELENRDR